MKAMKVTHATAKKTAYGRFEITATIQDDDFNEKEFSAETTNTHDLDRVSDLEGKERYTALFSLIENKVKKEVDSWQTPDK